MKINNVQSYNICNNDRNKTSFKGHVHQSLLDSFYKNSLDRIKVDSPIIEDGVQRILSGEFSTFKEYLEGTKDNIISCFFKPVFDLMEKLPANVCLNQVNTRVNSYNFAKKNVFVLHDSDFDIESIADRAPYSTSRHVAYSYDYNTCDEVLNLYGKFGYILTPEKYTPEQLEYWIRNYGWREFQKRR